MEKRRDVNFLITFGSWQSRDWGLTQPCFVTFRVETSKQLSELGWQMLAWRVQRQQLTSPSKLWTLSCANIFFCSLRGEGRGMAGLRKNNKPWYLDRTFPFPKCFHVFYFIRSSNQLSTGSSLGSALILFTEGIGKLSDFPQTTQLPMGKGQCPVSPPSIHCFSHCACLSYFPSGLRFSPSLTPILVNNEPEPEHQYEKLHLRPLPYLILHSLLHSTLWQVVCFQAYASLRSLFLLTSVNLVTLGFSDAVAMVSSMPGGRGGRSHSSSPIPASGLALSLQFLTTEEDVSHQGGRGVQNNIPGKEGLPALGSWEVLRKFSGRAQVHLTATKFREAAGFHNFEAEMQKEV